MLWRTSSTIARTTNNNSEQFKKREQGKIPPEGITQSRSQLRAARDEVIQEKTLDQINKQPGKQLQEVLLPEHRSRDCRGGDPMMADDSHQ